MPDKLIHSSDWNYKTNEQREYTRWNKALIYENILHQILHQNFPWKVIKVGVDREAPPVPSVLYYYATRQKDGT